MDSDEDTKGQGTLMSMEAWRLMCSAKEQSAFRDAVKFTEVEAAFDTPPDLDDEDAVGPDSDSQSEGTSDDEDVVGTDSDSRFESTAGSVSTACSDACSQ